MRSLHLHNAYTTCNVHVSLFYTHHVFTTRQTCNQSFYSDCKLYLKCNNYPCNFVVTLKKTLTLYSTGSGCTETSMGSARMWTGEGLILFLSFSWKISPEHWICRTTSLKQSAVTSGSRSRLMMPSLIYAQPADFWWNSCSTSEKHLEGIKKAAVLTAFLEQASPIPPAQPHGREVVKFMPLLLTCKVYAKTKNVIFPKQTTHLWRIYFLPETKRTKRDSKWDQTHHFETHLTIWNTRATGKVT